LKQDKSGSQEVQKMNRTSIRIALSFALVLLVGHIALSWEFIPGLPPFGSFSGGPFDIVNNSNLNVHFEIPVLNKAGRDLPFNYPDRYESTVWHVDGSAWSPKTGWGWPNGAFDPSLGYVYYSTTQGSCSSGGTNYTYHIYSYWHYKQPSNPDFITPFSFTLSDASIGTPCTGAPPYSATQTATDGSGVTISATAHPSATIYFRSGNTLNPSLVWGGDPSTLTDTNGNQITATVPSNKILTDTLGTTAITASGSGTPSSPVTIQYTNATGTTSTFTVNYTTYTVQTNFGCSGISEYGPQSVNLVSEIDLPDDNPNGARDRYTFSYEPTPGVSGNVTGRLASVTLPTGGTISYQYTGSNNGIICADGSAAGLTRTTPDGAWTYTRSGSDPTWSTTITDPQGNQTLMNFQGIHETERRVYQGSSGTGTLLDTVYTCYNGAAYPCNTTTLTLPITQIAVTNSWASGQTSQTVTSYNTYGLPTEVDEYGYGSGSVGSLVRKTLTSYASLGNNINDRPSSVAVYAAGASNPSSQTTYTYDQGSVTTTTGTPNHISVSGSRGNPTTTTYSISGTSTISTTATYFDTGTMQRVTDSNANQTTYSYGTSSCGNSFATSISMVLSLSRSQTWNCNGGLIASNTDENGQTTSYSYDLMNRLAQTNFADGGWKLINYTSATQHDAYSGITSSTPSTGCTSCRHDQLNFDGLGRQASKILVSDPEGQTTVATVYDSVGRVQKTSNPYRSTSDPTYGFDTNAYDALNRVTSITHQDGNALRPYYGSDVGTHGGASSQICSTSTYGLGYPRLTVDEAGIKHQTWADALGRTIEADEADSSGNMTLGTCYAYDALNNLTQTVQGSQTRTYAYDMLSRKTSETTPEGGTTNFYYTTSGGALCSGNPRLACRRSDARSITTTYAFDALNRLTSKTYSDTTPAANFYYDESSVTVAGTPYTLTNTKGRLSHTSGASGTAITVHSYDKVGRHQDLWQCTPYNCSSTSIWNTHYNYDLAGDVTSWRNPSSTTLTHTVSNARRITQITSSLSDSTHPATIAQNVKYAPHGAVSQLQNGCVGAGCTQAQETYDYNNRLQPVRMQLGTSSSPSANSCLVYNYYAGVANPTSCVIPSQASSGNDRSAMGHYFQDTTNPSLGHTVSYTYDNIHRLAISVATGSAPHNLAFSYDRYGNMTCVMSQNTNGPCPNYSYTTAPSTNQIANTAYTYDAAGNLTADGTGTGSHTYQWDAENRLTSIDSGHTATYTYNALGQRVEKDVAGAYTEYAYHASGTEVGENNRSNWSVQVIPFRGRHVAHYQGSATYFNHNDRLGTTSQVTSYSGSLAQDQLYYPWGQEWSMVGTAEEKLYARLSHRDQSETGLDPTHFRMFSSTQGRWFSPDPAGRGAMRVANPQTLNRYAYVANNPANFVDPLGLQDEYAELVDGGWGGGGGGSTSVVVDTSTSVSIDSYTTCTDTACTNQTTVNVTADAAFSPEVTAMFSQVNTLTQGPMNYISVAATVETGGIIAVEAAPAYVAVQNANAIVTVAGEIYVGWQNIYDFGRTFVNNRLAPTTPAGVLGNIAGNIFRHIVGQ
jgi:RHS repeat-associated protein